MNKPRRVALIIAGGIALFNLWHISIRPFWPGSIINAIGIGPNTIDLARHTIPGIQIHAPYDGQFCFAIAHDPVLITGKALPFVDAPSYRYRRLLYPLLTWMFSFGQAGAFPIVMFLINLVAWGAAGVAAWRMARHEKIAAGIAALAVMSVTGLQFAALRSLTEPLALALILWGIYFLRERRWASGFMLMGLATLARETSIIAFATAAVYLFIAERELRTTIVRYVCLALVPMILWNLYLPMRLSSSFDPFSVAAGPSLVLPFVGILSETRAFLADTVTRTEWLRTFSITIETIVLMAGAVVLFWWRRSLWSALGLAEAIFCSVTRGEIWNFFPGSSRAIINLTVFVLMGLLFSGSMTDGTRSEE